MDRLLPSPFQSPRAMNPKLSLSLEGFLDHGYQSPLEVQYWSNNVFTQLCIECLLSVGSRTLGTYSGPEGNSFYPFWMGIILMNNYIEIYPYMSYAL